MTTLEVRSLVERPEFRSTNGKLVAAKDLRYCRRCGERQSLENFYRRSGVASGLQPWCKRCTVDHQREWRRCNAEVVNAKRRERRVNTTAEQRATEVIRIRDYHRRNPDVRYRQHIKKHYGMTWDAYCDLLQAQGYACAACGGVEPGGKGRWSVDHDHESGQVRGLLCHTCNTALPYSMTPDRLRRLADYLVRTTA